MLQPILEDSSAQAVQLREIMLPRSVAKITSSQTKLTSSRRSIMTEYSDPDNGIYFLDNLERVKNPTN